MSDRWRGLGERVRKRRTIVVGLYGGPGTGKSTNAALVFGKLKEAGVNAELVTEFAKDLVWAGRQAELSNQVYVFAKQQHRVHRLLGKVDVVVTDSPILLTNLYHGNAELRRLVEAVHDEWRTVDILLVRDEELHPFRTEGRTQKSLAEAQVLDRLTREMLDEMAPEYWEYKVSPVVSDEISADLLTLIREGVDPFNDGPFVVQEAKA